MNTQHQVLTIERRKLRKIELAAFAVFVLIAGFFFMASLHGDTMTGEAIEKARGYCEQNGKVLQDIKTSSLLSWDTPGTYEVTCSGSDPVQFWEILR